MKKNEIIVTNININLLEASSELAHDMTRDEMFDLGIINSEDEMFIFDEDGNIDYKNYTELAQDIFNTWYDYFWGKLYTTREN